jgi:hypothetical protein
MSTLIQRRRFTGDCVFAYSKPRNGSCRQVRQLRRGDTVSPEGLPSCRVSVDDLLP